MINYHSRRRRGTSFIELLLVCLIFAFLVAATAKLYRAGEAQQRTARFYSDAQSNCREAVRRFLRTARHGYAVESGVTPFNGGIKPASGANQVIFTVPQPNNWNFRDHIRFYVSGGTLYAQRSDDADAGLAIATGVTAFTINYFKTDSSGSGTTATDGTPTAATEVQVTLTVALPGGTTTVTRTAYVAMRNASLGF